MQLTLSVPFVAVAAAAFGAAYESTLLHENSIDAAKASTSQYLNALQLLQSELHSPNGDHVPLIIASVLLAASEAVQHHEQDALSHVIGAFSLHTLRDKNTVVENQQSPYGACQIGSEEITDSLLEDVFRSIDVQISTFLWRRQPFFGMKQLVGPLPARTNIEEVIYDQPALLHSSVHFLSKVLQDGCQYLDDFSPSLVHEQEHLISMLHIWLTNCNELLKKENMPEKSPFTKAQTQMSYDKYEKQFGQMLKSAELVLAPAKANSIEGPFNGSTEAEIAQRIVELEEDRPYKSSLDGDDDVLLTQEDIPDISESKTIAYPIHIMGYKDKLEGQKVVVVGGSSGDVRDEAKYTQTLLSLAPVDHIVFSAVDTIIRGKLANQDLDEAKHLFGVKFWGAVLTGKILAKYHHNDNDNNEGGDSDSKDKDDGSRIRRKIVIIRKGGSLTLTSGTAGLKPGRDAAIGGALNGAVLALTRGLATDFAGARIRVNTVVPGLVKTALWDKLGKTAEEQEALFAGAAEKLPVGFVAGPEHIAEAYLYAIRSEYTTGKLIEIGCK
ncbi:hypothetical protein DV738_g1465, partial [Chaetothyriales sp. CBS 135597]